MKKTMTLNILVLYQYYYTCIYYIIVLVKKREMVTLCILSCRQADNIFLSKFKIPFHTENNCDVLNSRSIL